MKGSFIPLLIALSIIPISLRAEEDDSQLEQQMKILARGMRQLTQQVANPTQSQSSISLLESLKKATVDSKAYEPRKTREISAEKKAAFLADYRTDLDELKDSLNQIEDAVKAGKFDQASSLISTVNAIKKDGHGKFKQD